MRRIDTHHHIFPPAWCAEARERIIAVAAGLPISYMFDWTPARAIDAMDGVGLDVAIGSVSAPGVWLGDSAQARRLAHECNEYGAELVRDHPRRFGIFAILPMPDVEGTLREIEHALDVLKLDGVCFMTNFGETWPGDARYAEVFDELNRRRAVAFFHPTTLECCPVRLPDVPPAILEFPFDSTRAITSLLFSGTFTRCADMRFLFSHGGGTLPFLADRIATLAKRPTAEGRALAARLPNGVEHELRRLYYDTASIANTPAMAALRALVPDSQILLGTDYPYVPIERNVHGLDRLGLDDETRAKICERNAASLLPRFEN